MRIKSLEIKGFKSFCDRTLLDFPSGITAIVGPNGCGKSNIVDAIRWVSGEQSAKELRGRVMEDVIFNGTAKEQAIGVAEVNLIFSNENGDAPESYSSFTEIMVTRRLYRSGDSEYLINRVPCRRRDIVDFFMGTGIGKNAYSIVEQGKVESLINVRPEERRAFIEEAAGVSRYRSQREAAVRRMETTQANLLRVSDIEEELKRQISVLKRQARKAQRFKELRRDIRNIELGSLAAEYKAGCQEITSLEEQLQKVRDEELSLSTALQTGETMLEEVRLRVLEGNRETASTKQKIYDLNSQIHTIESQLTLLDRRVDDLKKAHERQGIERRELIARLEQESRSAECLRAEAADIENRLSGFRKNLETAQSLSDSQKQELSLLVEELNQNKMEQARADARRLRLEAEHAARTRRFKEESEHQEALEEEAQRLQEEAEEVSQKLRGSAQRIERSQESKRWFAERCEQSRGSLAQVTSRLSEKSGALDSLRQKLSAKTSRLQSLKEMEERYEFHGRGVQEIMRLWKASQSGNGVHTLVADIFHADARYETAVEAALGHMLHAVVIDNPHEGVEAIQHVKSSGTGRVSFVPLHPRSGQRTGVISVPEGNGILGPLMEHVEVKDPYRPLARALLGEFLLVRDLPAALAAWESQGETQPMVTLEGDVFAPLGAISGGRNGDREKGILRRKREIRELAREAESLHSSREELQKELAALTGQREEALQALEECREELQREEITLATTMKDRTALEDLQRRLAESQESVNLEQENAREVIEHLLAEIYEQEGEGEASARQAVELESRVKELAALVQERQRIVEHAGAEVTRLKVEHGAMEQRSQYAAEKLSRLEEFQKEGMQKAQRLEEAQQGTLAEIAEMEHNRGRFEAEKKSLMNAQLEIQQKLESLQEKLRRDSQELQQQEETCRRLRKELNDLITQRASHLNLEISRVQINQRHLEERAAERHNVALSQAAAELADAEINLETARDQLEHLRAELERLGEVNLMADTELEEIQKRYTHLSEQRADLVKAMEDLDAAIARIDRETRQRFLETFQKTNQHFGEIFPVLFGGGRGELVLTGIDDPLESGVDLVVQPPGKKLQSISLLSGGEKALAAVALLFSLYLMRPSPVCLLDEVDAPLDEINVERFGALLRQYCTQSQFVVVTHNKRTMAMADTLYGITMEEPGISKLVSVRLNGDEHKARHAEETRAHSRAPLQS